MPIDLDTIGYFLFMEEQERKEARSRSLDGDTEGEETEDKEE